FYVNIDSFKHGLVTPRVNAFKMAHQAIGALQVETVKLRAAHVGLYLREAERFTRYQLAVDVMAALPGLAVDRFAHLHRTRSPLDGRIDVVAECLQAIQTGGEIQVHPSAIPPIGPARADAFRGLAPLLASARVRVAVVRGEQARTFLFIFRHVAAVIGNRMAVDLQTGQRMSQLVIAVAAGAGVLKFSATRKDVDQHAAAIAEMRLHLRDILAALVGDDPRGNGAGGFGFGYVA